MHNHKKADKGDPKHYDQMLVEKTKPHKFTPDKPGTIDWLLQKKEHRAKDTNVPWETQLGADRDGEDHPGTLEAKMDQNKQVYNLRRTDKAYANPVPQPQGIAEAHDQKHYEVVRKAEGAQDQETMFWDKYVGVDVSDSVKKKVPSNNHKSQLQNHPDRFKSWRKSMPVNEKMQEDEKSFRKEDKIYDMVTASLKDADAIVFQLFAKAALEERELNDQEKQQLSDVNSAKARLLAFINGDTKQQFVVASKDEFKVWERSFGDTHECKDQELESFSTLDDAQKAYPDLITV